MKKLKIRLLTLSVFAGLTLSGCSDLVEIQDRDFVLAMGISSAGDELEVSFALPDISVVTEQDKSEDESLIKIIRGASLPQIADEYNANSDKRLDYRHLKAIIVDKSMVINQKKMEELALYLDNEYDISRNAIIFYSPETSTGLLKQNATIGGSIGEYLERLSINNQIKNDFTPTTAGDLIDGCYNDKYLMVSTIRDDNSSVSLDGALLLYHNSYQKELTEAEKNIIQILNGSGSDYIFPLSPDYIIRLKTVSSKTHYDMTAGVPTIRYNITGTAEYLPKTIAETDQREAAREFSDYIAAEANKILQTNLKDEQLDFLNLYRKSSYKNRSIWSAYADRSEDFLNDVEVVVHADIKIQ